MIKAKQTLKKDTRFLDNNIVFLKNEIIKQLATFNENYAKPLVILGFSCCYPITILLTSSKGFPISILVIAYHILFALHSKIVFWAKSWVSLKKVFYHYLISLLNIQ